MIINIDMRKQKRWKISNLPENHLVEDMGLKE
jgi:hypothetical protein